MPREGKPDMQDPTDKELHSPEGVNPYPVPSKSKVVGNPHDDDTTPAGADYERGEQEDETYVEGTDRMRKTLKREGVTEAWKDGKTQGSPPRKH